MRFSTLCLSGLCSVLFSACSSPAATGVEGAWLQLPSIAADNGYERGVSAPFIGMLNGRMIVAGGCNFPGVPAAEGGAKRFYADILALNNDFSGWRKIGTLPQPLAYGASFMTPDGIVCAGGTDSAGRSVRDVFLLAETGVRALAPLPETADNCSGAYLDGRGYVVGNRSLYIYDCAENRWQSLTMPDNRRRLQAVCVAQTGKIWIFGGYDPAGEPFFPVGYAYDPETGNWEELSHPTVGTGKLLTAGGTGVAWGEDSIVCFGGVNDSIFEVALERGTALAADPENDSLRQAQREYMEQEPEWYRFNDRILIYNTVSGAWTVSAVSAVQCARAGSVAVEMPDEGGVLLFNGEIKPGIRTPEAWLWRPPGSVPLGDDRALDLRNEVIE